jgi:O-6-methylguanine DNA methyltransferase
MNTSFSEKVLKIVRAIPKGKVLTYREVATFAGNENAVRAVGTVMRNNQDKNIPCHRVIRSDRSLGEYNGLQGKSKRKLLESEGVVCGDNNKVL